MSGFYLDLKPSVRKLYYNAIEDEEFMKVFNKECMKKDARLWKMPKRWQISQKHDLIRYIVAILYKGYKLRRDSIG